MLTKLKKIKKLGIFSDFTWGTSLQIFGRFNLIYGWNGSGKSTLATFFAGLPVGSVASCPELEYEIETEDGTVVKNGKPFPAKIRVFNRDYVANNVHTVSGKAKPILILGVENKKIADEIVSDETALAAKSGQMKKLEEEVGDADTRKDKIFSDIAKTIGMNTSGLAARNYRKPDAERDFAALPGKAQLDDAEVAANVLVLKQQEKPDVPERATPRLSFRKEEKDLADVLGAVEATGESLCAQTVESRLVERLRQNPDIANWVEHGITLHKTHASKTCEFCDQALPPSRIGVLAAHFNEADKRLKDDIDGLLQVLAHAEQLVRGLQLPDKANLYDELQGNYQSTVDKFTVAKSALLKQIDVFRAHIEAKKAKTTESVSLEAGLDGTDVLAGFHAANVEIKKHNEKTANFTAAKDAARTKLETHYLSTIYDEIKGLEKKITDNELEVNKISNGDKQVAGDLGIVGLTERIKTNRAKISSSHKGCQEINSALKTFLGRDELQFEVEKEGYVLMRGKKFAVNISEGEKTAIGFVHFVIHLKDQDFDPANGIVVVDDPVSSLDANSIFQAFSFLKNSVKDAQQVFLLTHNFDFLRLLINWISHSKQKPGYYMIKNAYSASGDRSASMDVLDKLLREHESEYHYLFKLLHTFQSDGTIESVYNVPNIARKVLDTFLMFRVPSSESNFLKMEALKPFFDENKLTAIYKFANHESHITGKGFDPSLVAETQKKRQVSDGNDRSGFP